MLGKVIKDLRQRTLATQEEFAKKVGITPQSLSRIEGCRAKPGNITLAKIARELKVPIEVLHFMALNEDLVPERNKDTFREMKKTLDTITLSIWFH